MAFALKLVLFLALSGGLIGYASGFLGIGGTVFIVPVFDWAALQAGAAPEHAIKIAMGSALFVSALTAFVGFLTHRRYVAVARQIALPLSISVAVAAFFGGFTASHLTAPVLYRAFGFALLASAAGFVLRGERDRRAIPRSGPVLVLLGLVIGYLAALVGLGGALFAVLVFAGILGCPIHEVVLVSSLIQTFGATVGCCGFIVGGLGAEGRLPTSLGWVNLPLALSLGIVSVPLAVYGARRTHRTSSRGVRIAFALLLILLSVRFFLKS